MPITPPQLDDLRYDRVVEELLRRIPVHAPEWTDYNDSDPGVTLIQLFAFLAEQIGYRLNRVPEKDHIELLKLLGVRLQPARAATTRLALLLADPSILAGYTLAAGARAKAKKGQPPPLFETDIDVDVVPAQPSVLLATKNPILWDLLATDSGRDTMTPLPAKVPDGHNDLLAVAWDGKAPKLKDMPLDPVALWPRAGQSYLWIGLNFNPAADAGFRDARVTLTVQLDDDEQPRLDAAEECGPKAPVGETPTPVDWLHYYDAEAQALKVVPGRIDDATSRLTRSGTIRFVVPFEIGAPPDDAWKNLREPSQTSALAACLTYGSTLGTKLKGGLPALSELQGASTSAEYQALLGKVNIAYEAALVGAIQAHTNAASAVIPPLGHPLDPQLRALARVKGWLRIAMPSPSPGGAASPRLRMLTFNAVPATNARTERNEFLGVADGRPRQTFTLANGDVLAGTLELAVQEDSDPTTPLVSWTEIDSLDAAGPFDRVFDLDREAGVIRFGDGRYGRIVPLVPGGGQVVALIYRHGGGKAGEVPAGAIASLETAAPGVENAVNFVAATGGRDAETLDDAKRRARKEVSTRSRAVTAGDFAWIAGQTEGVRVARVEVVPLRRPLPAGSAPAAPAVVSCGALPAGAAGLDTITAYGAVSVVVVPDEDGPEPVPTPSFLVKVCRELDAHRLVTTEAYVVPPQYARLCNLRVTVRGKPGYTRTQLQDLVGARLATYLHVLRGGPDGAGFPFGGQLHAADLIAQVYRTEGVDRVDSLRADFTRTKSNAVPRQGSLVLCPASLTEFSSVTLGPEENVSLDLSSFTLTTAV